MKHVTFVCHGNICRSPMAEYIFINELKKRGIENKYTVISRATSREEIGSNVYYPARKTLEKHGVPYSTRQAKQITDEEYRNSDFVVCMDERNVINLYKLLNGSDYQNKIHKLMDFTPQKGDVADPWYTGDFETTYKDVLNGCTHLIAYLEKL